MIARGARLSFAALAAAVLASAQVVVNPGGGGVGGASGAYSAASASYTTAAPYYFPPGGGAAASTTETSVQGYVATAGTIQNFSARVSSAPGSNTITFTWRKNASDQTVTCAITGAATSCSDLTHQFQVAVGDLIDIKAVATTGTVTAAVVLAWGTPGTQGPAGPTVYPGSGIANSTGAVWGTSYGTTGSGTTVVLGTGPTISAPTITGHPTIEGVTSTGAQGTGPIVFGTSPTITGATVDGVTPTVFGFLDPTSSVQNQLNSKAPLASPSFTGTFTLGGLAGSGTRCLHISNAGLVTGTGSDCGTGGGGGIVSMTTGTTDPSGSCTAPSSSNLALYTNTSANTVWECVATNTWYKILATSNTGGYQALGSTGTAPSTPSSGSLNCYYDSTANVQICLDALGGSSLTVRPASLTAHQWVQYVDGSGTQNLAQPSSSDLSDSSNLSFLNVAQAFSAGAKKTFAPSATTAGARIIAGALPSSPATGDLAIDSGASNILKFYNGSIWQSAAGASIATTTSVLAGDGAGNAVAVTGSGTNCVLVNGTSAACTTSTNIGFQPTPQTVTSGSTTSVTVPFNVTLTDTSAAIPSCVDGSGNGQLPDSWTNSTTQMTVKFSPTAAFSGKCTAVLLSTQFAYIGVFASKPTPSSGNPLALITDANTPGGTSGGGSSMSILGWNGSAWVATSGSGGGSSALSAITAATGSNTIASGNNPQIWNWAQTSNSQAGITFGETSAATSGTLGNQYGVKISGAAGSTAVPLGIISSLSGSQTLPTLHITPTWNTTGVVDAALLVNVTNTASGSGSKLFDLQVGGTSQFAVDKGGAVTATSFSSGASPGTISGGTSGAFLDTEGTAPTTFAASGYDGCYASSTQHGYLCSFNNASAVPMVLGPASSTNNHVATFSGTGGGLLQDSGTVLGTAASVNTGTSGATIPLLNGTNTWSATNTFSASGGLALGANSGNVGLLTIYGNSSGSAAISVAAAAGATSTILLPSTDPTNGQVLTAGTPSGGKVQLSWATGGGGGVTSVTGTAPIVSSGGTTPAISLTNYGCTDYPAAGALSAMNTAGHVYCLSGAYTFSSAQTISASNVTIVMWGAGTTITRTSGTTDLFDISGTNDQILCNGAVISGNSAAGTLFNLTGATRAKISGCNIQNFTAAAISGTGGDQHEIDHLICDTGVAAACISYTNTSAISNIRISNSRFVQPASSGPASLISFVQNSSSPLIKNVLLQGNQVLSQDGGATGFTVSFLGPSSALGIDSVKVLDNHFEMNGNGHSPLKIFGVDHGVIAGNTFNDLGGYWYYAAVYGGDFYDMSVANNTFYITNGTSGAAIQWTDGIGDSVIGNTINGASNGGLYVGGIQITTSSGGNCDRNVVANNTITLANATATAIYIYSQTSGKTCNNNLVMGNIITGTNASSQIGINLATANSGALVGTQVANNTLYNVKTGISIGSGATNTVVETQRFDTNATATVSDSGTTSSINTHTVVGSGTLTSASPSTLTVTLANNDVFTTGKYQCAANDQTTQTNPLKITYTSGTSFTITGPNTVTDTVGYVCSGY